MEKGAFIVFEGIDGSGKTTQAKLLQEELKRNGFGVLLTKEPTDGPIGQIIRRGLRGELNFSMKTIQLLFTADRSYHLETTILPALREGKVVISDRYFYSTIAYGMLELEKEWLKKINSGFLEPDMVFLIDIDPETSLERLSTSRKAKEKFEDLEKLRKVRENYLEISKEYKNFYVVNGNRNAEEIHRDILKIVKGYLYTLK